ncbi:TlpA family protein disulfide reductase [Chloroflexales bacterium ZM16-3]|nr:TlpA family protein disulfide reductase [Chloroflexales bacterium ZM16-3]
MLIRHLSRALAGAALALTLAACGAATTSAPASVAEPPTADTMMADAPTAEAMMADAPTAEAMMDDHADAPTAEAMMDDHADAMMADAPAWQQVALTDARSGQSFTLADFAGKTVYVEPMATWCSNCRQQLGNVREAKAQLGDNVVFIGLSVETTISAADLAAYADKQGFDWTFAVATPDLLQQLTEAFGRTITNPPSTPHFIIRPDGSASELMTGFSDPQAILAMLQ